MGRGEEINRYKVFWITLDPTEGSEIAKTRPCVIISPDELNRYLRTVIVAPMTTAQKKYPYRINCVLAGKSGNIALDQIRTVDKNPYRRLYRQTERRRNRSSKSHFAGNVLLKRNKFAPL
jgi:mRNA interferase MazF